MPNYWSNAVSTRITRRRALAAGAAGSAALFLAACGGSDSNSSSGGDTGVAKDKSGLLTKPVDTSKQAKRGGTLPLSINFDVGSFDPTLSVPQLNEPFGNAMGKLFTIKPGYLQPPDGSMEGEIAESVEYSPDGLQATFKLRNNLSWHPISPVDGRAMDADDIRFSWDLFSKKATYRNHLVNSISPLGPVSSVSVPDNRTLVMKLAYPAATLEPLLGFSVSGGFWFVPKEADGKYDYRNKLIGLGPYYLDEYVPSTRFVWKRFEKYWDVANRAYVDKIEQPILVESASRLAQFKTGSVFFTNGATTTNAQGNIPSQEELLQTLKDVPELKLYQDDFYDGFSFACFGYGPPDKFNNPWRDERVRQAFSMSWDRDTFLEVRNNADKFKAAGFPFESRWHTAIAGGAYEGWWLDPKSKEFGENAKYYKHDIAEAKKLLAAAGHPNGFEATSNVAGNQAYLGSDIDQEVLNGMAAEAGFRFKTNVRSFNTDYIPNVRDSGGKFEGWTLRGSATALMADLMARLVAEFHSTGSIFVTTGFDANGRGDASGDPKLDADIERANKERDANKRKAMVWDIQRYIAKTQYTSRHPGTSKAFRTTWPALKNVGVFRGAHQQHNHRVWIDQTEAPYNKK